MNRRIMGGLLGAATSLTALSMLVAPSATADDVPCGAAAVPAVHETVTHPAGEATVPAQTHLEWLWTRKVPVREMQYVLVAKAFTAYEWVRESGFIEGPDGELTSSKEAVLLPQGAVPAGDGWELTGNTFSIKSEGLKVWSLVAPLGTKWEATGKQRVAYRETETTSETSPLPPPGDGWVKVPGSEIVVIDVAEQVVVHEEPWTEEVLVSPALPAGAPCPTDEPTSESTEPAADPTTDATVLGVEQHRPQAADAPVAVPTAVDAGLGSAAEGSGPWLWLGGLLVAGAAAGAGGVAARRPAPKH